MRKIDLTEEDQLELLEFIKRYYPELREEVANTDDREFRKFLEHRQAVVQVLMERLQEAARA